MLPFNNMSDIELRNLFVSISEPSSVDMYFDPTSLSDLYTCDWDPVTMVESHLGSDLICSQYFDTGDLPVEMGKFNTKRSFSLLSQNIRSLGKNFDEFALTFDSLKFDAIALTETWLSKDLEDLHKNYNNYLGEFLSRHSRGGGVGFFLDKNIIYQRIDEFCRSEPDCESIFVDLPNLNIILANFYRPPSESIVSFLEYLESVLDTIRDKFSSREIFLCGDFNLDIFKHAESRNIQSYINLLFSHGFSPMARRPTRVTPNSSSLIDNIWTNSPTVAMSGIVRSGITDHFPIFLIKTITYHSKINEKVYVTFRDMSATNHALFKEKLSRVCWEDLLYCSDVDFMYDAFYRRLSEIFESCFPTKTKLKKTLDIEKPYINSNIRGLLRKKHKL